MEQPNHFKSEAVTHSHSYSAMLIAIMKINRETFTLSGFQTMLCKWGHDTDCLIIEQQVYFSNLELVGLKQIV